MESIIPRRSFLRRYIQKVELQVSAGSLEPLTTNVIYPLHALSLSRERTRLKRIIFELIKK